jgi:hypothetical protein
VDGDLHLEEPSHRDRETGQDLREGQFIVRSEDPV